MFMSLLFLSTFLAFNPATITNSSRLDDGRSELQNGKFLRLPISQRQSGKSCDNLAGNFDEDSESQPEISTFMHPFYARIEGDLSRSNSDNGGEGESVFRYVLSAGALISNRHILTSSASTDPEILASLDLTLRKIIPVLGDTTRCFSSSSSSSSSLGESSRQQFRLPLSAITRHPGYSRASSSLYTQNASDVLVSNLAIITLDRNVVRTFAVRPVPVETGRKSVASGRTVKIVYMKYFVGKNGPDLVLNEGRLFVRGCRSEKLFFLGHPEDASFASCFTWSSKTPCCNLNERGSPVVVGDNKDNVALVGLHQMSDCVDHQNAVTVFTSSFVPKMHADFVCRFAETCLLDGRVI